MSLGPIPFPSDDLLARYDVNGPRYTSYPTVPEWRPEFSADDHARAIAASNRAAPLGLYVHLPFCRSLCWYCGCNVVISKDPGAADLYLDHLERELDLVIERLGSRRALSQVHWGGGTPTFLTEPQLERLWRAITARFDLAPGAEVAIEVHPSVTTNGQLRALRSFGFNRVSLGLQDFDPIVQRATHRIQSPERTREVLEEARALGFGGANFDLIYGLPFQNAETWKATLDTVIGMRPDRLAIYSFAFIPEVLKHQRRMPAEAMPRGREKLDLFRAAWGRLQESGYLPIGLDHFALPDDELARAQATGRLGRNFQGYTVAAAKETVAVGASAISDVGGAYAQNVRGLTPYYERLERGVLPTERGRALTLDDRLRRSIITEVMCNLSVDLGADADRAFAVELERLHPLEEDGLVERRGSRLCVTREGRMFVRNVAMAFDAYLHSGAKRRFSRTV